MRVLWLAREIPFPRDAGDRIYSAQLAQALAQAGCAVFGLGHGSAHEVVGQVVWLPVPGGPRARVPSLLSRWPLFAAVHATSRYEDVLTVALRQPWDAVVFDQLGMGWALPAVRRMAKVPVRVYLAHNHETVLWDRLAREADGGRLRRWVMRCNAQKVARLEQSVLEQVDLVAAITDEDAAALTGRVPGRRSVVLTPGYGGSLAPARQINAETPRRVVLLGSYGWVAKQENLRRFLAVADPAFAAHGVTLDVLGRMPEALRRALAPGLRATRLHGFVDDVQPFFDQARLAVVPEVLGGGFKLKFLDYVFGRLPVASIADATAGLPESLRAHLLVAPDVPQLVALCLAQIDQVERLNALHTGAAAIAQAAYAWADRGQAMADAIRACQAQSGRA